MNIKRWRLHNFAISLGVQLTIVLGVSGCHPPNAITNTDSAKLSNSLFIVKKNGKYGYINRDGKVVIDFQFDAARDFSEGMAGICVGPCKFFSDNPRDDFSLDQTFQGLYGFIDTQGKLVINPRFTVVGQFSHGLAAAATGELKMKGSAALKLGYIDRTGAFVIPPQFQTAGGFDEGGFACVSIMTGPESRYGFIDANGKFVINPQLYSASGFDRGLAAVIEKPGMTSSYIDRAGRFLWRGEPDWEDVK